MGSGPKNLMAQTTDFLKSSPLQRMLPKEETIPEEVASTETAAWPPRPEVMQRKRPTNQAANQTVNQDVAFAEWAQQKSSPNSLYKPGSIFPSPYLLDAEAEADGKVATKDKTPAKKPLDILQPQPDDSELFCKFLELIEETPPEERGVDDAELALHLERFREDMQEEVAQSLEPHFIVALRKKILPRYKTPQKKTDHAEYDAYAESEEEDFAERQAIQWPSKKKKRSAPEPAFEPTGRQPAPQTAQQSAPTSPIPLPAPVASHSPTQQPVYPSLTQLDGSTPSPTAPANTGQPVVTAQYLQANHQPAYGQPGMVMPVHYAASQAPMQQVSVQGSWEQHSKMAADLLRQQLEYSSSTRTFANEAKLRLLELVNGNRSEAARPFREVDKPFNEFWGDEVLGLAALMDELGSPDEKARYVAAAFRLDEALMDLRKLCPIRLKNVRFARDVQAFGDYLPRSEECSVGEKVDVYLELENPTIRRTGDGYNVSASLSYEIRSNSGNVLDKVSNIAIQSASPSQRRDYYVHLRVKLPDDISQGDYQLRISVTDLNDEAMQFAEEQISFKVIPTPVSEERAKRVPR